jgi:hypothetical protein
MLLAVERGKATLHLYSQYNTEKGRHRTDHTLSGQFYGRRGYSFTGAPSPTQEAPN